MTQQDDSSSKPQGLVWIDSPYPVTSVGLAKILENEGRPYVSAEPPPQAPCVIILGVGSVEGVPEGMRRVREHSPHAPVIIFGLHLDLSAAQVALRSGARGFIHAGMQPEQIRRAVRVALKGEMVAPRQLLEYLISQNEGMDPHILSTRQQEILELVGDGLTNDRIAKKLFLSESTVKQHLRAAYKTLGVKNRTEAAKLLRKKAE